MSPTDGAHNVGTWVYSNDEWHGLEPPKGISSLRAVDGALAALESVGIKAQVRLPAPGKAGTLHRKMPCWRCSSTTVP
jgi:hypothetical protein